MPRALHRLAALAATSVLAACATRSRQAEAPPARDPWEGRGAECVRLFVARERLGHERPPEASDDPVLARLPAEARRTARAAGIEPLVASALHHAGEARPSLEFLQIKQELGLRLISLETQLAAIIFEAECTGELIEAMAFELDQGKQTRSLGLAVSSLVVGAAFATAAGVWDLMGTDSPGPAVLALTGGLGSAALGAAAFVPREGSLTYRHERNLLLPMVRDEDREQLFPPFVFRLLTLPASGDHPTPRARLLARFQELIEEQVESDERAQASALLYGAGGRYSQDLLALRERMYDALEAQLNALARDLELLDRTLVRELALRGFELDVGPPPPADPP